MSEQRESSNRVRTVHASDGIAIKNLCQAIETANENGALFFLAQALLMGGRIPITSKELTQAMHEAAQWLQSE